MDNKELIDLGEVISSLKSAHKRIDELQLVTKAFYELASDVKVMVSEMANMKTDISEIKTNMKKDISDIKSNIDEYHRVEPNKLIFNVKNAIIVGIFTTLLGAIFVLILK